MVWYPAYLDDKQEIVDWIEDQRPDANTGMISDTNCKMADVTIFAQLNVANLPVTYVGNVSGNSVSPADINYFLWAASMGYNLEYLAMRGVIHYTHGGIESTKFGQVTHTFMRMQPMFFIPRGSENLDKMMPFRSYKQLAQLFVQAYIRARTRNVSGTNITPPLVVWDASDRGYGYNAYSGFRIDSDNASSGLT